MPATPAVSTAGGASSFIQISVRPAAGMSPAGRPVGTLDTPRYASVRLGGGWPGGIVPRSVSQRGQRGHAAASGRSPGTSPGTRYTDLPAAGVAALVATTRPRCLL